MTARSRSAGRTPTEATDASVGCTPSIESLYSWWLAGLTLVIASVSFGAVTSIPILLKPMTREWHAGAGTLTLVYMTTMFCGGLGSLVLGRMLDRLGFFRIAVVASLAMALGLYIASQTRSLMTLHLAYGLLIGGIGQGAFFSPLAAALSQWFDRHRALAIAIAASGQSVGGCIIPPVLRWGAVQVGWRTALEVYAVVAGSALICCSMGFRRAPPQKRTAPRISVVTALAVDARDRRRAFGMLGVCLALFNLVTFTAVSHLTAFGEERGYAPVAAAALMSALLGATLISRLAAGVLSPKRGTFLVMLAFSLLHVVGVSWLATAQGYPAMVVAACLVGIGFGGYLPGYALLAASMFPVTESGRRIAEIYFFGFISAGIGSSLGGWLRDFSGGYESTFISIALIAWLALAILFMQRKLLSTP